MIARLKFIQISRACIAQHGARLNRNRVLSQHVFSALTRQRTVRVAPFAMPASARHCTIALPPLDTLPWMPPGARVPSSMLPRRRAAGAAEDAAAAAARLLHGRCLILLGDSSMTETAHDLAVLLHGLGARDAAGYLHRAVRMPGLATAKLGRGKYQLRVPVGPSAPPNRSSDFVVTFARTHRKMWFTAPSDTVVLHRSIAHENVSGNGMGIAALGSDALRAELAAMAQYRCGSRPRSLWLQSGYHDVLRLQERRFGDLMGPSRARWWGESCAHFERALAWAEGLAPHRLWLSRHAARGVPCPRPPCPADVDRALEAIEGWVRAWVAARPAGAWRYVDHREAWACSPFAAGAAAERRVPVHTGAIQRFYADPAYEHAYLSPLRTWLAVEAMAGAPRGKRVRVA